jgi:AcrR family transcriptional regulator
MEAIARRAGVGVGTLYRHFPKRIDVVEAVYRTDVDNLVQTAEQVSADLEPWPAVVAFLEAFVRYAQGKRTFLNELREAFDKNPDLRPDMVDRVQRAMELVVGRAQDAGVIRTDVSGSDLMQLVGPMCTNATLSEEQSMRLLTMILDGLPGCWHRRPYRWPPSPLRPGVRRPLPAPGWRLQRSGVIPRRRWGCSTGRRPRR